MATHNRVNRFVSTHGHLCGPDGRFQHQECASVSISPSFSPIRHSNVTPKLAHSPLRLVREGFRYNKATLKTQVVAFNSSYCQEKVLRWTIVGKKRRREEGGINRLNDKEEQCWDSEQLAFPCVDGPVLLFFFCASMCACTLDGDRLSCDCSFLSRALLIGVIDCICRGKQKTWQMALNQMSYFISPLKIFSTAPVKRPQSQHLLLVRYIDGAEN